MLRPKGTLRSSFGCAFAGLWWAIKTQRNMRLHIGASVAVVALALLLRATATEAAVLTLTCTVVLAAEMLNTVVEAAVDLASPERHPLARIAKDVAAGAVLLTAIGAVVVGLLIFVPHLLGRGSG